MKANNILVLSPVSGDGYTCNVANSAAIFVPPVRCAVVAALAFTSVAVANATTLTIGLTNTAVEAGSIVIPANTVAYSLVQDSLAPAYTAEAGVPLLVCQTAGAGNAEKVYIRLVCETEADTPANDGSVVESA